MSALHDAAEDYLRMRRALGYKLEIQGLLLNGFVSYLKDVGAVTITIENAVAWATLPAGADPAYWAERLSVARQFARHLQTLDRPARFRPHGFFHTGHDERSRTSMRPRRSPRCWTLPET